MPPPNVSPAHAYWFPAKRYGWGWGLPSVWQGWLALALYVGLLVVAAISFRPDTMFVPFVVSVVALSTLLLAICWLKGEPPRWRWDR